MLIRKITAGAILAAAGPLLFSTARLSIIGAIRLVKSGTPHILPRVCSSQAIQESRTRRCESRRSSSHSTFFTGAWMAAAKALLSSNAYSRAIEFGRSGYP